MAHHIKTLLTPYIQTKDQWKVTLLHNWESYMGALAKHVSIEKIFDDTIILGVSDSCWLQELYLLSTTILQTINKNLDSPRIKEIRFKQTGRTAQTSAKGVGVSKKEHTPQCVQLSTMEKKTLENICDPELRTALKAFLIRCHRERVE